MAHDPVWLRESGRLLSSLVQTSEDELDDLRRERLGGGERPDRDEICAARAVLLHLAEALRQHDDARWQGVRHARQMLDDWEDGRKRAPVEKDTAPSEPPAAAASAPPAPSAPLPVPVPVPRPASPPLASPWAPSAAAPPSAAAAPAAAMPQSPVMPFAGSRQPPQKMSSLEPNALFGQTAPADTRAADAPALPFAGVETARVALDLDRYASFCAENACWPDHRGDIVRRYGLDEAQAHAVEAHYRQRLKRDPALDRRFAQLLEGHRRRLLG